MREVNGRLMSLTLNTGGSEIKFIAAYAPTAGKNTETKIDIYYELTIEINSTLRNVYVAGDFNARMYERLATEKKESLGTSI